MTETTSRFRMQPVTGNRPVEGNRLHLFTVGDDAFAAAYEAMKEARTRIWLETYIFEPDEVGNMVRKLLIDAARRDCSVILLVDRIGSPKIDDAYLRPLIDAGCRVAVFNPLVPWKRIGKRLAPIVHRDHRKILIVDDVGFCGGANVSSDYGGPGPELFFDLTLRIDGPVVADLAALVLDTLRQATGSAPPRPSRTEARADGATAQVLALSRREGRRDLDVALHNALHAARQHCFVMTPYFVPPRWFIRALIGASLRGVDVRLLTAGRSDVPLARVAGRHVYTRLLKAGIRVFEMQNPVLHAKSITLDDAYSIVGSYNVDVYGGRHNLEVGVASTDKTLSRRLREEFVQRLGAADEAHLDEWLERPLYTRLVEWLLHLLFRF